MKYAIDIPGAGVFTPGGRICEPVNVEAHNAAVEARELAAWAKAPELHCAYIVERGGVPRVETWLGSNLGVVTWRRTYRNNFGAKIVHVNIRATNGADYYGRLGENAQLVRLRKASKS